MKAILAAAASLALLATPNAASAATFTYEADYCVTHPTQGDICDTFVLEIDTVNHTGVYTQGGFSAPLTWAWNTSIQGAILDLDMSAIVPGATIRMMAFVDGQALYGAVVTAKHGDEVAIGRFDAVRVPSIPH